jgi:hypothetical protein
MRKRENITSKRTWLLEIPAGSLQPAHDVKRLGETGGMQWKKAETNY